MEFSSKLTGKEPLLQRHYLEMFYGLKQDFNIANSRKELGFNPRPSKEALEDTLVYLKIIGKRRKRYSTFYRRNKDLRIKPG